MRADVGAARVRCCVRGGDTLSLGILRPRADLWSDYIRYEVFFCLSTFNLSQACFDSCMVYDMLLCIFFGIRGVYFWSITVAFCIHSTRLLQYLCAASTRGDCRSPCAPLLAREGKEGCDKSFCILCFSWKWVVRQKGPNGAKRPSVQKTYTRNMCLRYWSLGCPSICISNYSPTIQM